MNLRLIIALLLSVCIIGCEMNEQPVEEILIKTEEAPKETIEEPVFKICFILDWVNLK